MTLNSECGVLTRAARKFRLLIILDTVNLKGYSGQIVTLFFFNVSYEENEYRFFNKKCNHPNIHLLSGLLIVHFGRNS